MSSTHSGTSSGFPSEHGGNGSIGASAGASAGTPAGTGVPASGTTGGPTGAGTFPDPSGSPAWSRSGEAGRSEFGAFLDDLSELARGSGHGGDLRGELERRVELARVRMSTALDQGREMTARARDQMSRGLDYSRDTVVERPLSSVAVAAVAGLLIGLLLSRRD